MTGNTHFFIALALSFLPAACGDNSGGTGSADAGPNQSTLDWQPCEFAVVDTEVAEGVPSPECASLAVPLMDTNPSGDSITVGVRRYVGTGARLGQIWYLEGGPGGTGLGMESDAAMGVLIEKGWDFYVPIHRGLKGSTPLSCPSGEALNSEQGPVIDESEFAACADELTEEWGSSLEAFNADEQAHDLAKLIRATNHDRSDVNVSVWGTSYGTYRALKFLEHYPEGDIANAVVIDAVLDLQSDPWNDSVHGDAAALPVFVAACLADAICAQRTAGDPKTFARQALAKIEAGTCAPLTNLTRQNVQYLLTELASTRFLHSFIFPFLDRIDQCTDEGAAEVIKTLEIFGQILDPLGNAQELSRNGDHRDFLGELLYANVSCRDLHRLENTSEEITARDANLVFARDEAASLNKICPDWPTYRNDARPATIVPTQTPLLIVQGVLDFPTPPQWAARASQVYPNSQIVEIPTGGHGMFDISGDTGTPEAGACLVEMLDRFLREPSETVDGAACVALDQPIDLVGDNGFAQEVITFVFSGNLWELTNEE